MKERQRGRGCARWTSETIYGRTRFRSLSTGDNSCQLTESILRIKATDVAAASQVPFGGACSAPKQTRYAYALHSSSRSPVMDFRLYISTDTVHRQVGTNLTLTLS